MRCLPLTKFLLPWMGFLLLWMGASGTLVAQSTSDSHGAEIAPAADDGAAVESDAAADGGAAVDDGGDDVSGNDDPPRALTTEFVLPAMVEEAAARLSACTVTVRVLPGKVGPEENAKDDYKYTSEGVIVCSGVSLSQGLVVTFISAQADSRFRVTLPGGEQSACRLSVVDHYSGLSLLETDAAELPGLEFAVELPAVGGTVLCASAAGIEKPSISLGILSGAGRSVGGLPPVLECDLRTTDTSSGAPVVDRQGCLLGVVAATDSAGERNGWTYAIPARHVQRLVAARTAGQVVVLDRRPPVAGLTLGSGDQEGTVIVERVAPGGPADKAGILVGDVVVQADGRTIRSAYQAVDLILKKIPGENVALKILRSGEPQTIDLALQGGIARSTVNQADLTSDARIGPQLSVRALAHGKFEVKNARGVAEVGVAPDGKPEASQTSPGEIVEDELELLRSQLDAFGVVIARLQEEIRQRDEHERETARLVQELSDEVQRLRKKLDKSQPKN